MRIIGCDLHAPQQSMAMLDTASGEVVNRTVTHEGDEGLKIYSEPLRPVLVGIKAIGPIIHPRLCIFTALQFTLKAAIR